MAAKVKIEVLYEDPHLLVVDKPKGLLVVPAPGRQGKTVVDLVGQRLGTRVYAVHRLDEDTTGVLILAKTMEAREALEGLFERHAVERIYLTLLSRTPSPPAGRIESRLAVGRDGIVRSVLKGGEPAITHYRLLTRRGPHALVVCRLETGRRNQIRAHMAELGAPVVGDRKYGHRATGSWRRPLLHARKISFQHPMTGVLVSVVVDAPEQELHLDDTPPSS